MAPDPSQSPLPHVRSPRAAPCERQRSHGPYKDPARTDETKPQRLNKGPKDYTKPQHIKQNPKICDEGSNQY